MFHPVRMIKLILIPIALGTLFWILLSVISVVCFHDGDILQQIFAPTLGQAWPRILVFFFMFGFAFHADYLLAKHNKKDQALRASEDKYRRLVELSPDAIVILSNDQIVFVNSAGAKLFGARKAEELVGKSVDDFLITANPKLDKDHLTPLAQAGASLRPTEGRIRGLDGILYDVEVSAVPFTHNGKSAIQVIYRDITDQKKDHSELVKLRKAVESSGEVIFLTDREGVFSYVNPEFTRLYGYRKEEVIGKATPSILKSGMLSMNDYRIFWNTILSNNIAKGIWINKNKAGGLIHIEGSANPVLDDDGNIVGFLAIQHNITEHTQVEGMLQQQNKELSALYTIAATVNQASGLVRILNQALGAVLALDWLGGGGSSILFLLDEQHHALDLAAHRGVPPEHPCLVKPPQIGECLCGLAIQQNDLIMSDDGLEDIRHTRRWPEMESHRDICLPIHARGRVLGVMDLRLPAAQTISDSDINLLKSIADQIGMAIENARLDELNQRVIFSERERIARDLHDDMGQLLGYVNTKVAAVRLLLKKEQYLLAEENLIHLEDAAQRLSVDVRKAILDLKTSGQAQLDGNLALTLRNYIDQLNLLGNLNVKLEIASTEEDLILLPETTMQMLRIVQEALTNAIKHAGKADIIVCLNQTDHFTELKIMDNGSGFDLASVEHSAYPHFGIDSMRERVSQLGGKFIVDTKPGSGTTVRVTIPATNRVEI